MNISLKLNFDYNSEHFHKLPCFQNICDKLTMETQSHHIKRGQDNASNYNGLELGDRLRKILTAWGKICQISVPVMGRYCSHCNVSSASVISNIVLIYFFSCFSPASWVILLVVRRYTALIPVVVFRRLLLSQLMAKDLFSTESLSDYFAFWQQ